MNGMYILWLPKHRYTMKICNRIISNVQIKSQLTADSLPRSAFMFLERKTAIKLKIWASLSSIFIYVLLGVF